MPPRKRGRSGACEHGWDQGGGGLVVAGEPIVGFNVRTGYLYKEAPRGVYWRWNGRAKAWLAVSDPSSISLKGVFWRGELLGHPPSKKAREWEL